MFILDTPWQQYFLVAFASRLHKELATKLHVMLLAGSLAKERTMTMITPTVGAWYQDVTDGHLFEIVAIDEQTATIETQHYDGAIEEYDFETWRALSVREAAEPEDWSAPFEMESQDHHEIEGDLSLSDWSDPLLKIEPHGLLEAIDAMDDGAL